MKKVQIMKKIIHTNNAPAAVGPYSQAVESNGMLFISGQIPINPETGKVVDAEITLQTEQVMKNIEAILKEAGYTFDNVIKSTCLLSDMENFADYECSLCEILSEKSTCPCSICRKRFTTWRNGRN